MPISCSSGGKARYRFRRTSGGKQRLAFCGNKVVEVTSFGKSGKKGSTKKVK